MKNAVELLEIENSAQFVLKGPSQLFAGSVCRSVGSAHTETWALSTE